MPKAGPKTSRPKPKLRESLTRVRNTTDRKRALARARQQRLRIRRRTGVDVGPLGAAAMAGGRLAAKPPATEDEYYAALRRTAAELVAAFVFGDGSRDDGDSRDDY